MNLNDISNNELQVLINEWIKGEKNRAILKRRLIDQICFERLAEEFEMSSSGAKKLVYRQQAILFKKISENRPETSHSNAENWALIL